MKKFTHNNQSFICINCKKEVPRHPTSSRDHCNHCLYGLHVDINPGDRQNECKGLLKPIGLKIFNTKTQIVYKCRNCEQIVFCTIAPDDDKNMLIELSSRVWQDS